MKEFCTKIGTVAKLYRTDCLYMLPIIADKAKAWDKRVHVITDPPYEDELHEAAMNGRSEKLQTLDFVGVNAFRDDFAREMVNACTGWMLAFTLAEGVRAWRDPMQAAGAKWDTTLFWVKPDATPRFNGQGASRGAECIVSAWCGSGHRSWNGGGRRGVFTHNCNWRDRVSSKDGGHPTEKPLGLMMELISLYTNIGDIVIDPFMGSGTTGEACIRLGRVFVGIEKDERYYRMAVQRLRDAEAQDDFLRPPIYKQQSLFPKEEKKMKNQGMHKVIDREGNEIGAVNESDGKALFYGIAGEEVYDSLDAVLADKDATSEVISDAFYATMRDNFARRALDAQKGVFTEAEEQAKAETSDAALEDKANAADDSQNDEHEGVGDNGNDPGLQVGDKMDKDAK